jgi:NAD(P)-dependent dehydrogenase (short-subunit alcohol dehydrogenase family)
MDLALEGASVLITGASGSIGKGLARGFSEEGARLFITDLHQGDLEEIQHEIQENGGICASLAADVTRAEEVVAAAAAGLSSLGDRIDVLVNGAGIVRMGKIEEIDETAWDDVLNVNCKGTFLFTREVVPQMKRQKRGKIINFSSKSGKTGSAYLSAYSAAKAAIIGFTQSLAYELSTYGINVNCVCPGLVSQTGIGMELFEEYGKDLSLSVEEVMESFAKKIPLGRLAKIDDVVDAVLFLASSRSDYMTGQAVNVSGGREMH